MTGYRRHLEYVFGKVEETSSENKRANSSGNEFVQEALWIVVRTCHKFWFSPAVSKVEGDNSQALCTFLFFPLRDHYKTDSHRVLSFYPFLNISPVPKPTHDTNHKEMLNQSTPLASFRSPGRLSRPR